MVKPKQHEPDNRINSTQGSEEEGEEGKEAEAEGGGGGESL